MPKKSNQIFIKLTSDHPKIFQNIQKHESYINHMIEKQTNSQFFIEVIQNGLIYIYDNMDIFKLLNQPISALQILRYIKKSDSISELEHIFPHYLTEDSFPTSGLTIFFHTESSCQETILEMSKIQFRSLLKDQARITTTNNGDLSLHFLNFDGFSLYLTLLASILSGIFQKIPEFPTLDIKC